jgi:glycosyltransferase involved in cell wall biosynthesis
MTPIQLVISSDDGFDYSGLLPADSRIIFAETGLNTGPAAARNRALARAAGSHVCMMDADDSVSGLFMATLFKAFERHDAFALRSVYVQDGCVVRAFLERTLTLENFVSFYGSVLVVAPRSGFQRFQNVICEDGLATIAAMHRFGGSLPVVNAEYRITLHSDSYCAAHGHTFTSRYRDHLEQASRLATEMGDCSLSSAISQLYRTRLAMSERYDRYLEQESTLGYHEFILEQFDSLHALSNPVGHGYGS